MTDVEDLPYSNILFQLCEVQSAVTQDWYLTPILAHITCIIQAPTLMYIVQASTHDHHADICHVPAHLLESDFLSSRCLPKSSVSYRPSALNNRDVSIEVLSVTLHEQPNDQTEESKNSSEDLNRENLDKADIVSIRCVTCCYAVLTVRDLQRPPGLRYFR